MAIVVPIAGQEISAEAFGIPVANQVNANTDAIAAAVPPAWTNLTFQNGWASEGGFGPVAYRLEIGGVLRFRGSALKTGTPAGAVATLPPAVRPSRSIRFGFHGHKTSVGGAFVIRADLNTAGVITLYETQPSDVNMTIYFDGLVLVIGA